MKTLIVASILTMAVPTAPSTYKFWEWTVNDRTILVHMLHNYIPSKGDSVEFYIEDSNCDKPGGAECTFTIGMRKHP